VDEQALVDRTWSLVSYAGADGQVPAAPVEATLTFDGDGRLAGGTGGNRFFGRYDPSGAGLLLTVVGMTQMACVDAAVAAQEQALLAGLGSVRRARVDDRVLTLLDDVGTERFTYRAVVPADLAGTSWQAVGVNNGREAVVSSAATEALSLRFDDEGRVNGFAGCNTFRGPYETTTAGGITIGPLATTRMAGPPEAMALEGQFLAALQAARVLELSAERLTLRDEGGATQATFRRRTDG
jgi:heat shock protein HslJ